MAAIARANRLAGHPLDTRATSICDVLRGIGRLHGATPKRAQALATEDVQMKSPPAREIRPGYRIAP